MPILPNQQTEVSQPTPKPSFLKSKKFIAAIIFLAILIAIILTLFIFASKKQSSTAQNYTLSTQDKQNQQVIKKLTGFDWTNYPKHPNNSEEQSLASLMLLYSEETAVFSIVATARVPWPSVVTSLLVIVIAVAGFFTRSHMRGSVNSKYV